MVHFSSRTFLLMLALAFICGTTEAKKSKKVAYRQAQNQFDGIPDCSDETYGTHCAKSSAGHREFCDHDSSILVGNIPRSICAPMAALTFLMGEGDYCGKCKPPEGLFVDIIFPTATPTTTPSGAPSTAAEKPVGGSDSTLGPAAAFRPTVSPTKTPSGSSLPSSIPSAMPSVKASASPSGSSIPSSVPSDTPSIKASSAPSGSSFPSAVPSDGPSAFMKTNPLITPAPSGSSFPSSTPSSNPSAVASGKPSGSTLPSSVPSDGPSAFMKTNPLITPAPSGSSFPSSTPSSNPSAVASGKPSGSAMPSSVPSGAPSPDFSTENPTAAPTPELIDASPTEIPTDAPTAKPPVDIPTGGSDGEDGPTRALPNLSTNAPSTASPSSSPSVSVAPPVSSLQDSAVVAVTTTYSLTLMSEGELPDDQLATFEGIVRDFINQNQPLDTLRGTIVINVDVLEQRLDNQRKLLRRKLQTQLPVTVDMKIDGIVSPNDQDPYDFGTLIEGVFISHKLVLRNDLVKKGIIVTIP